jgi:hypothetical protein
MRSSPVLLRLPPKTRPRVSLRARRWRRRRAAAMPSLVVPILRMSFPAAVLAMVVGVFATSEASTCCEGAFTARAALDAPLVWESPLEEEFVETDDALPESGDAMLDPAAAAGGGTGGGETMPSTRPCPGFENVEAMLAAAASAS